MTSTNRDLLILMNTIIFFMVVCFIIHSGTPTITEFAFYIILGAICGIILIYQNTQEEIHRKRENSHQKLYEAKALPNTLLIDDGQKFVAYSGTLFITTTSENNYLGIIRLQDQFKILNYEVQKGSLYLIRYEIETNRGWHTIAHTKQKDYLQQIYQHFEDFKSALHELIPGVKTRPLTIEELDDDCGLKTQPRVKIDFIPEIPNQEHIVDSKEANQDFEDDIQLRNELISSSLTTIEKA